MDGAVVRDIPIGAHQIKNCHTHTHTHTHTHIHTHTHSTVSMPFSQSHLNHRHHWVMSRLSHDMRSDDVIMM